jgi:hypothetical protein
VTPEFIVTLAPVFNFKGVELAPSQLTLIVRDEETAAPPLQVAANNLLVIKKFIEKNIRRINTINKYLNLIINLFRFNKLAKNKRRYLWIIQKNINYI